MSDSGGEPEGGMPARWDPLLPSSDGMFRLLFEEAPCYCCILDREFNILAVNRSCRESFTTPFTRRCYQVFKSRQEACGDCPARTTLKEGRVSESTEKVLDRSGEELHVICRTAPIRDKTGKTTGVLHMAVRAGQAQRLRESLTAMESQVGAASHGIKGLLTAMSGGFYLWDTGLEKSNPERMDKGLKMVRRNFRRLQRMAHNVLYYVRDRRLHVEDLEAGQVLESVFRDMEEDADMAGARLALEPAGEAKLLFAADRRAVESALANLVTSALDDCYADKRPISHVVRLGARREGGLLLFEVADNAAGLESETLEKMFSLFFNPKGIEAAGVGLFMAHKIVRLHKGKVDIRSEAGTGTRYFLCFPAADPA